MSRIQRLRWYLARASRAYRRDMAKARKEGASQGKRDEIQHGYWAEIDELHEELEALRTKRLLRRAHRFDVPYPQPPWHSEKRRDEYWVQGNMTGEWYLTTAGFNKVRGDIRAEIKSQHEARTHWIAWIAALTGLLGALTGLVAVWLEKRPR
jgi:hypothetical protein